MALGSLPLTLSDILDEIQETDPLSLNSAKARWLAGAAATGNYNVSDFAEKMSVKIVANTTALSATTPHTFSSVDFGVPFTGRVLVACIGQYAAGEVIVDQTACTIGGQSCTGGDAGHANAGGPSASGGIWAAALDSGSSGDVTISWNSGTAHLSLILLSISGISVTPHAETTNWSNAGSTSRTINIPSNGVLITSFTHSNTNDTTMTGVTERMEVTVSGGRHVVGFDNKMEVETGRTVSASWSGGGVWGGEARSYQQS